MKTTAALLAISVFALAACGSSYKSSSSSGSSSSTTSSSSGGGGYGGGYGAGSSQTKTTASSSTGGGTQVSMHDDSFSPTTISGKPGSTVKIQLKNDGSRLHNFTFGSVSQDVSPGSNATVSVKIPASGSMQFYCQYHRGLGMVGTVKAS